MVLNIKKNCFFFSISQKQEQIEQNDGHFMIQRRQITLKKFLSDSVILNSLSKNSPDCTGS